MRGVSTGARRGRQGWAMQAFGAFPTEVFISEAGEATGRCLRTYVLGERAGRHLIRPALLGLCHAEEEGIGRGQRASREPCQEASAVAQETDDGGSV